MTAVGTSPDATAPSTRSRPEPPGERGLRVHGLAVDLAGRAVLRDVALTVEPGQVVGLVGPNGAGKTTLMRAVLGVVPRRSGEVVVDGRPVRPGRSGIGHVPQRVDVAWDFPVSVADMVASGLTGTRWTGWRPGAAGWRAVAEALDRTHVRDLADRPVAELSGGQRQRVLLARALVLQSSVLLLDEPLTGLDVPAQDLITSLVRELADDGLAVLMSTHDLVGAVDQCDRFVLVNGTVRADGPTREVAADVQAWVETFRTRPDSALVRALQAV